MHIQIDLEILAAVSVVVFVSVFVVVVLIFAACVDAAEWLVDASKEGYDDHSGVHLLSVFYLLQSMIK